LIHDLDHQGIKNMVLVQEESPLALKYNNKSVAEQNSGMCFRWLWWLLVYTHINDSICCIVQLTLPGLS
jgi:3'5'-cyclic nucleotide phosphodiesterase